VMSQSLVHGYLMLWMVTTYMTTWHHNPEDRNKQEISTSLEEISCKDGIGLAVNKEQFVRQLPVCSVASLKSPMLHNVRPQVHTVDHIFYGIGRYDRRSTGRP
jgi:hypothetical protein